MTLSLVIPAYNETARLLQTLAAIEGFFARPDPDLPLIEVLIVDDGSTDGTASLAESWNGRLPIKVLRLPHNRGKGAAVREGMLAAKGDAILMYDADGATPINEVIRLRDALEAQKADIAIGSRVDQSRSVSMQGYRRLIGSVYRKVCGNLHPGVRDAACGCKLFRHAVAKDLFGRQHIDRFAFDVEVLSLAIYRGYKIAEVPVRWTAVEKSKVVIYRDGPQMFFCILKLYWERFMHKGAFTDARGPVH